MREFKFGTYTFDKVGPSFVAFRIETPEQMTKNFLEEIGLIKVKSVKRWRTSYEFDPDFQEFLNDHGYFNTAEIIKTLRTVGLLLKADRAIAFRLRFL
ncbi:hypothetical protein D3C87_770380 [compost metagenome]